MIYQSQRLVAIVKQQLSEPAFIVRVAALLLLRCEIWYSAPFQSLHSRDFFCHGSYKWAYGSNSLLDIRSCANRTNHISGLDDECFFVKYQVKCSICKKTHVVFYAKLRGILTFCPDRKCTLKYVAGLRLFACAYFWISFWLTLYFSASMCPCTNCKFQRKINDTHQLIVQAKFRMSANFGNFGGKVLPGWDSRKFI